MNPTFGVDLIGDVVKDGPARRCETPESRAFIPLVLGPHTKLSCGSGTSCFLGLPLGRFAWVFRGRLM